MTVGGETGHPNLHLIYGRKFLQFSLRTSAYLHGFSALKSLFWDSITVLKLLTALSKSSTRLSDHLNMVFESVRVAATRSTCVSPFVFHGISRHSSAVVLLLLFISLRYETTWLGQPNWFAFQKRASTAKRTSSFSAHLM